jgi:RNA polymerase sigma-70 factor (sigma-E family)
MQPGERPIPFEECDGVVGQRIGLMTGPRDTEFEQFVRSRRGALLRTASILAAGDVHLAEDVVQSCLTRLYLAWPRARRHSLDAYVRRMLVNAFIDEKRRPSRREAAAAVVPDRPSADEISTHVEDPELLRALAALPVGMRAAVVLRHVDDLSVDETAAALRCSTGNVKSQTARGLDKLREQLGPQTVMSTPKGATDERHE